MFRTRSLCFSLLVTLSMASGAAAQQRTLSGRVIAGTGEPVPNATVNVTGTTIGALTNEEGRFAFPAPAGALQVSVRRIGYRRQVVSVPAGQSEVTVILPRDVLQLGDVVVTGQATAVSRLNAANDVATVNADELVRAPAQTLESAMAGKIAGVSISQNSGAPGGGIQVQLRGVTTINANVDPLFVVDGVIVSNDAIASGANAVTAAAAGGNASNQDNPVNRIADLNPNDIERIELLKGASASAIYGSKASNGVILITTKRGTTGAPRFSITQRLGTYDLSNKIGSRKWDLPGVYAYFGPKTAADSARYQSLFGTGAVTDYEELLFGEHGASYETNANVRGGAGGTRYYVSGLAKRDAGIMKGTGYNKQALRANLNQVIGSRLTLDLNTNFVHSNAQRGLTNNDNSGTSFYMVLPFTPSFTRLQPAAGTYPAHPFERSNPIQTRDLLKNVEAVYRFIGAATARYNLLSAERQSLALTLNGGVDQFSQRNDIYSPNELIFEPQDGLPGTSVRGDAVNVSSNFNAGLVHMWTPAARSVSMTTSAGLQRERRELSLNNVTSRGLIPGQSGVNQGSNVDVNPVKQLVRDFAVYAQEELLALDERVLLTAGVRADRSTNNGDVQKFHYFPKASASYRFIGMPFTDELKLRLAWGQSGNPAVYGAKFTSLATSVYSSQTGVQAGVVAGNPNIKPERQTELEGGVDLVYWKNRGSIGLTLYDKTITDLILLRSLGPSSGFTQQFFQGGSLQNRGIEITAALSPIQTASQTWVSRITFSKNKSKITSLPIPKFNTGGFGVALGAFQIEEGKSATQIVGRRPNASGGIDVVKLGDAAPDFQVGFGNEFTWNRFRLNGLVDWKKGGDIINLTEFLYDAAGNSPDFTADPKSPGQLRITRWSQGWTQEFIQDGSYVKIRELAISYQLPQSLTRIFQTPVRGARIEFSGRNLFTFTSYRGLDPEVSNFGNQAIARNIDVAPYPPSRSFFVTLDVEF